MTSHFARAYLKYRMAALSRHGVHSPFVYRLMDECLNHKQPSAQYSETKALFPERWHHLVFSHHALIARIAAYFKVGRATVLESAADSPTEQTANSRVAELVLLPSCKSDIIGSALWLVNPKTVLCIAGIHDNQSGEKEWLKLKVQPEVRLSIDLFYIGLCFFDSAFIENQNFVLKI